MIGDDHIVRAKGAAGIFPVAGSCKQNVDLQFDVVPRA
jgi:hypothetical protein